jgi:hypothetical protein
VDRTSPPNPSDIKEWQAEDHNRTRSVVLKSTIPNAPLEGMTLLLVVVVVVVVADLAAPAAARLFDFRWVVVVLVVVVMGWLAIIIIVVVVVSRPQRLFSFIAFAKEV